MLMSMVTFQGGWVQGRGVMSLVIIAFMASCGFMAFIAFIGFMAFMASCGFMAFKAFMAFFMAFLFWWLAMVVVHHWQPFGKLWLHGVWHWTQLAIWPKRRRKIQLVHWPLWPWHSRVASNSLMVWPGQGPHHLVWSLWTSWPSWPS